MDCVPLAMPVFLIFRETLAEPVAHVSTRLTEHYGEDFDRIDIIARRSIAEELLSKELTLPSTKATSIR